MARIIRRDRALDDLVEHWAYRGLTADVESADRLIDRIERRVQLLAEFPESGTKRDELRPGLRSVTLGMLNIYYLPLRDGVELVRVLDGRRDIQAILRDEEEVD
jgi:toxin ParE1/3/4